MKSEAAFTELIGFITDHPALWAVNLGELSIEFSPTQRAQLLRAITESEIVCIYYDQGSTGSYLPSYKKELIAATRFNRTKHTRWHCGKGGEGDADVITRHAVTCSSIRCASIRIVRS
jgi:hypothetical protein